MKGKAEIPDLRTLAKVFQKYPDIQAVYLFGSFADGNVHRESDLDLAIVPRSGKSREDRLQILADLGYQDPAYVYGLIKGLRESHAYRTRSTAGQERMDRLVPLVLGGLWPGLPYMKTICMH